MNIDLNKRRKDVEFQLANLLSEVQRMDTKIRAYLADRHKNPHPRHTELVEKIQRFRIDPAITNKSLETMLDSLQWKVYYQSQAWKQMWANDDVRRRNENNAAASAGRLNNGNGSNAANAASSSANGSGRSVYSVERLWELQKEKLGSLGENTQPEIKEEFIGRIKKKYGQLASEKKEDEEIYMKFDDDVKRCTLDKRKRKIL